MKLSDLIIQYRQRNELSQREFARRAELSNSLISIIEKGYNPQTGKEMSPDMETYFKIGKAMGISIQKLFELLGDDATVQLISITGDIPDDISDEDYEHDGLCLKSGDYDRLEALHRDPALRLLFDHTRKMSHEDVEFMLQMAERIKKERSGE